MTIEERIKRLEDVLAKIAWDKNIKEDSRFSDDFRTFISEIGEERVLNQDPNAPAPTGSQFGRALAEAVIDHSRQLSQEIELPKTQKIRIGDSLNIRKRSNGG